MTIDQLQQLFDEYLALLPKKKEGQRRLSNLGQMPELAKRYENLEDYDTDLKAISKHQQEAEKIQIVTDAIESDIREKEDQIVDALPEQTWFRHGRHGIGVSYSNWGGSNYSIEVEPWQEKMPSLDHRYRGD